MFDRLTGLVRPARHRLPWPGRAFFGRPSLPCLVLALSFLSAVQAADDSRAVLHVFAGKSARGATPVQVAVAADRLPANLRAPTGRVQAALLRELRDGRPVGHPIPAQIERSTADPDSTFRVTFVLPGQTQAHASRRFAIDATPDGSASPWLIEQAAGGTFDLKNGARTVFRYNAAPVSHPGSAANLTRDAYIHPAYSPSGALVTGDFSRAHPHHRGFFLAYTKTEVAGAHPDFWNIQNGTGKIHCDRVGGLSVGPVAARFWAEHRWEIPGGRTVLRERWDVEAYDVPGQPYWLFDITSTQQAADEPLVLPPYRYGGMAYRGPDPFLERGKVDVLTSEGLGRVAGDQKPARWVDLTGPIAEGSGQYAGAMIADHPANPNHPTIARIHPTTLPFFCFVPSHDQTVPIGSDSPTVFRYRILIHDGHPDKDRNESAWRDFADPPLAELETTSR